MKVWLGEKKKSPLSFSIRLQLQFSCSREMSWGVIKEKNPSWHFGGKICIQLCSHHSRKEISSTENGSLLRPSNENNCLLQKDWNNNEGWCYFNRSALLFYSGDRKKKKWEVSWKAPEWKKPSHNPPPWQRPSHLCDSLLPPGAMNRRRSAPSPKASIAGCRQVAQTDIGDGIVVLSEV